MSGEQRISRRAELICVLLLLALGFAVRLAALGSLPAGLNQDEASAGYDAWAILNYGIDRCGNSLPVLLESWGSGQNALLSYLAMPFIALFGLSEVTLRLPMALSGCASLVFMWLLARRARGVRFGLAALLFLAVCPWHIMATRWALESNLLPAALIAAVYFTALSEERPWTLAAAGLCFGLALYAYGTAFFLLPPLLVFCVWRLRKSLRPAPFITGLALFAALALPIALCQLRNVLGLPETQLLGFTLPELTSTRQSATSVFGTGLSGIWDNLRGLVNILVMQSDGLPWNSAERGGLYYFFGLPLALLGVWRSAATRGRSAGESLMLAWLVLALACACLISVNVNRINFLWLPMCWFAALGLDVLAALLGKFAPALAAAMLVCFAFFLDSYNGSLGGDGNINFFPGLGEAIEYVDALDPDSAYISSGYVNSPYIFALFYTETPPQEFIDTVQCINPDGAFRSVSGFGYWHFGSTEDAQGEYMILHISEAVGRTALAVFGQYVVCEG